MPLSKQTSLHYLTTVALFSAAVVVGRVAFQFIPNVQPMTFLLIWLVLNVNLTTSLTVMFVSLIISNLLLGLGPWSIAQLGAYLVVLLITYLLHKPINAHFSLLLIWCLLTGWLYGLVISLVQAPILGIQQFLPYYLAGVLFDSYHAVGNLGFAILLSPILTRLKPAITRRFGKER